jgi:hypothetical protein
MPETKHRYHAEAGAINGSLRLPFAQPIEPQAHAKLRETGGYESQHAEPFRIEGIVSYAAAHTQVSGHQEEKHGGGFITLTTAVIEDLNVLNVVTADRVVAQISTEHPLGSAENPLYMPTVTFLGTNFYNLRIGGFPVEVDLDLKLLEDPPIDQEPGEPQPEVAFTQHEGFLKKVAERMGIVRAHPSLPKEVLDRFQACDGPQKGKCTEYSLVKKIEGTFPGTPHGNMIDIPHFGKVFLGVIRIEQSDPTGGQDVYKQTLINLTMIEIQMGCIASGTMMVANGKTNGSTTPPGGG